MATRSRARQMASLLAAASASAAATAAAVVAAPASQPFAAAVLCDAAPPDPALSDLLSRARAVASAAAQPSAAAAPDASTPAELARARALLDRYYALSEAAQHANAPPSPPPASVSPPLAAATAEPPTKPPAAATARVPAAAALRDAAMPSPLPAPPARYRHVIIGGGTAAWAAVDALLAADASAAAHTLVIAAEPYRPYNRPALSKELWALDADAAPHAVEYTYRATAATAAAAATDAEQPAGDGDARPSILRGVRAVALDVDAKRVTLAGGGVVAYDTLLLAPGGTPRAPHVVSPSLADAAVAPFVTPFRTFDDFVQLRRALAGDASRAVAVVGGGFLGAELALALSAHSRHVSLVVAEPGPLFRVLPRYACEFLARAMEEVARVRVVRSAVVTGARTDGGGVRLALDGTDAGGRPVTGELPAGEVVVAVGIDPEVGLARGAGLEVDDVNGGVRVNDFMMAEPDVFVAGDAASFHDRALGRRRVEHWDHAVVTGRLAGENMAGGRARYALQSMFWCDLSAIDVALTAVGVVDSRLQTVGVWNTSVPAIKNAPAANHLLSGVVYYLRDGQVVGVMLFNARKGSGALRRARALVDAGTNVDGMSDDVLGNLVNLDQGSFRMCVRTDATSSS